MSTSLASANQTEPELPQRVRLYLHGIDISAFIGDMPAILANPNRAIYWGISDLIEVADNIWFYPAGLSVANILQAAGHNPRLIDYAVPQEWFDLPETKERRDTGDKPMWSYEEPHTWGAPLWMSEVYEKLKREILTVLPHDG